MYAIVEIGGMQFKVEKSSTVYVPKMETDPGKKVSLDRVLMVVNGDKVDVGTPVIANAEIKATVVSHFKDEKVLVFKKKRRKNYKVLRGHRQNVTELMIDNISIGKPAGKASSESAAKKAGIKEDVKAAPDKKTAAQAKPKKTAAKSAAAEKKPEKKPAVKKTAAKKTESKKTASSASKAKKAPSKPSSKKEA